MFSGVRCQKLYFFKPESAQNLRTHTVIAHIRRNRRSVGDIYAGIGLRNVNRRAVALFGNHFESLLETAGTVLAADIEEYVREGVFGMDAGKSGFGGNRTADKRKMNTPVGCLKFDKLEFAGGRDDVALEDFLD